MPNYRLINPHIEGNLNSTFSGATPGDAALKTWDTLSSFFTNNVPQFGFTIEREGTGTLHHFKVNEKLNGKQNVSFELEEMKPSTKSLNGFKDKLSKIKASKKLSGGGNSDDSSSDSDDLYTEIYLNKVLRNRPIWYFWYYPSIYNFTNFYLPTFVPKITPYIEIDFYYWK